MTKSVQRMIFNERLKKQWMHIFIHKFDNFCLTNLKIGLHSLPGLKCKSTLFYKLSNSIIVLFAPSPPINSFLSIHFLHSLHSCPQEVTCQSSNGEHLSTIGFMEMWLWVVYRVFLTPLYDQAIFVILGTPLPRFT